MRKKIGIGRLGAHKMIQKNLIVIGGNSRLVNNFLTKESNLTYKNVFLLSHRKKENKDNFNIIDCIDPLNILNVINDLLNVSSYNFDVIISNTPPQCACFLKEETMDWALISIKLMNSFSFNDRIERVVYTGSCLALIPFYHNSIYKTIKCMELTSFIGLKFNRFEKNRYVILPPMYEGMKSSNLKFIFINDTFSNGAKLISKAIGNDKMIIFPFGLLGVICKMLFYLRYRNL